MLWKRKRKWRYFDTGLMAIDAAPAAFLKEWYYRQSVEGLIASHFEIIDLQRYKKIKAPLKVQTAMRAPSKEPFVFFVCYN